MNTFTVSFFGHREIERPFEIEKRLEAVITDLIKKKDYIEFLVGRDGEFDQLASSTVRRVAKRLEYGNTALVLVLPYMRAEYRDNEDSFHEYYDEVEICEESASAYPAAAFKKRNRSMVERSDLVICCVDRKEGGAYSTMCYAERSGKEILNLADDKLFSDKMWYFQSVIVLTLTNACKYGYNNIKRHKGDVVSETQASGRYNEKI